eukprot:407963-Rhodomonas_salina.1
MLRIHRSQLTFAFGAFVEAVQNRKRTRHAVTRLTTAQLNFKLMTTWKRFLSTTEREKSIRQRTARLRLRMCKITLRASIDRWLVEVSAQRAEHDELANEVEQQAKQEEMIREKAEQREEAISQVILRMQHTQLEFGMEAFIEAVRRKKRSRGRLVKAVGRSVTRTLRRAWSTFVEAKSRANAHRQREVRTWRKISQALDWRCTE